MDEIDCAVVGAGVVGLAIARALAQRGREVVILERERRIGEGVSSRNSEVVHAGLYYPGGSLKARLCMRGRTALYAYCASRKIAHRRCGKLIVATSDAQLEELDAIAHAGRSNGVEDLQWLDGDAVRALEPALEARAALHSPSSGLVDSHGLMLSLLGEAEAAGAMIAYGTSVAATALDGRGIRIRTSADAAPSLHARLLVNAAGLHAQDVAARIDGFPAAQIPRLWYAKGSYFGLRGRSPFARLIYPVPEPGGQGVHLTLDLAGQARFGPDVEWTDRISYDVDPARAARFYDAVRRYWPGLPDGALMPAYAGIRPKLSAPGAPAADFYIGGPARHGIPGVINLFGIESPGLTACLAIAEEVARLAEEADGGLA